MGSHLDRPSAPVASLADSVWLKGDLHLHSRHSKDSSNNSEAKIISFAESVGMDYLCITDHDNHVQGEVPAARPSAFATSVGEFSQGHRSDIQAMPRDHLAQQLGVATDQQLFQNLPPDATPGGKNGMLLITEEKEGSGLAADEIKKNINAILGR